MRKLKLSKAFTLLAPGPLVLVTTDDGRKTNRRTISWTMGRALTPVFAMPKTPCRPPAHACADLSL